MLARQRLTTLTDRAINKKKEGVLFRELMNKGLYKYKRDDFKSQEERKLEKKSNFNPWSTQQFNSEMNKAFLKEEDLFSKSAFK